MRERPAPTVRVFADFDGTVSPVDIGDALLRSFGGEERYHALLGEWRAGRLTAPQCYQRLYAAFPAFTEDMLGEFLNEYEIDPAFGRFARWCATRRYPLTILSDGFDAYIVPLLRKAGILASDGSAARVETDEDVTGEHAIAVEVRANRLRFTDGSPVPEFPYHDPSCPALANCKRNHMLLDAQDEDLLVYVGDGRSDFDAASYADMVFARGSLEGWCQEQNISFRRFYSFVTVHDVLSTMIEQGTLRPRRHARVLRQQIWMTG